MADDPYRLRDDLPHVTINAANTLDTSERDLPESDRISIGAETRWGAAVRLLSGIEERRDIDMIRVLVAIAEESSMDTADIERAIKREAKIMRSNRNEERRGGRPSKVDRLSREILSCCSVANEERYETTDQLTARNGHIRTTLRAADLSRSTFYRVRDRVREQAGIDLSEIISPSEVV